MSVLPVTSPPETATPWTVLCVDDEPNILSSLRRLFRSQGYHVLTAGGGAEGLELLGREAVDLVISDMRMPLMDGAAFLGQVRERWPDSVRLLLTGYADMGSTINAINRGEIYRYIAKPWDDNDMLVLVRHALERKALEREKVRLEALTQRQNEELKELNANLEAKVLERTAELKQVNDFLEVTNEKLKANFLTSIKVFSNLIEMRGGSLAGHSRRVADLARKIAAKMEMKPREVQDVFLAGLLHDIGKIGFSDVLLSTPVSSLSGENLGHYRKHAVRGEQALMALEELREAAKILRSHHERFDGQGFPDSLAGLAIPLGARILAVANDYDGLQMGMLSPRRATPEDAKALIAKARGKRYDPHAVEAFLAVTGNIEPEVTGEVQISPRDLQPDMVLARDLVTREGVLLLSADYILDYGLIQQIQGFNEAEEVPMTLYVRTDRRR